MEPEPAITGLDEKIQELCVTPFILPNITASFDSASAYDSDVRLDRITHVKDAPPLTVDSLPDEK
jgi:hypothetical protein